MPPRMNHLAPFVPARDFEVSLAFYEALGWTCTFRAGQVARLTSEAGSFLLQDFYEPALAENFMLRVEVDDAAAWAEHARALLDRFEGTRVIGPKDEPWGDRVTYVTDPSGVLWHFAARPKT